MANRGEEDKNSDKKAKSAKVVVRVEENMSSILSVISRSVPKVWPSDPNSGREEFSSICIGGVGFGPSALACRPTITLRLRDREVWRSVRPFEMEMLADRRGRRLFPTLSVSVEGLKADGMYTFFLDLMPKSQNIYTYDSGHWTPVQITRPYPPSHQASLIHVSNIVFKLGSYLMAYGVNLSSTKITSNESTPASMNEIFVYQRQIYLPRYHIVRHLAAEEVDTMLQSEGACRDESLEYLEHVGTYVIPETEFIAVSGYYNECVAAIKTGRRSHSNPGKTFRDSPSHSY